MPFCFISVCVQWKVILKKDVTQVRVQHQQKSLTLHEYFPSQAWYIERIMLARYSSQVIKNCGLTTVLLFQGQPVVHSWKPKLGEDMYRRRIPFTNVVFATVLGIGSAVYIYKPYFDQNLTTKRQQNEDVLKKQSEVDKSPSS